MRPLTVNELLTVWEKGTNQTLIEKSLHLLAVACSVPDINVLAGISIGERDARLLQLREWMFGSRLPNTANCPECSERVEWETEVRTIRFQKPDLTSSIKIFNLEVGGFNIKYRLPNSLDVARAAFGTHKSGLEKILLECILEVEHGQDDFNVVDLPEKVLEALNHQMGEEDPQADIRILLNCPTCAHKWEAPFDIVSYFWLEIDNWAMQILKDVSVIAMAFGWSENDILNMSRQRRQLYLSMLKS